MHCMYVEKNYLYRQEIDCVSNVNKSKMFTHTHSCCCCFGHMENFAGQALFSWQILVQQVSFENLKGTKKAILRGRVSSASPQETILKNNVLKCLFQLNNIEREHVILKPAIHALRPRQILFLVIQ